MSKPRGWRTQFSFLWKHQISLTKYDSRNTVHIKRHKPDGPMDRSSHTRRKRLGLPSTKSPGNYLEALMKLHTLLHTKNDLIMRVPSNFKKIREQRMSHNSQILLQFTIIKKKQGLVRDLNPGPLAP